MYCIEWNGWTWTPSATSPAIRVIYGTDGGDVDLDVAEVVARRCPLRRQQVESVVRAVVAELLVAPKRPEARLDGQHVVTQPWAGWRELGAVPSLDVRLDLASQAETETPLGVVGELPRDRCRHHRAARERDGDAGGERQRRRRGRGGGDLHPRHLAGLGVQHAGEADPLELDREARRSPPTCSHRSSGRTPLRLPLLGDDPARTVPCRGS